ncbi:MAG TPA: WalW protein [Sphingorhabdus sp.]|nr:WalW protein [Sphingorhabdus sp.]
MAQDGFGAEFFAGLVGSGVAEVGLQLHPWVTPPFDEEVNVHNSYACNLAPDLERTKLFRLFEIVEKKLGCQPDSYRAGRYGAGTHTPAFLAELGIRVDTSVRSLFDYRQQGGPNYARCPLTPYWVQPGSLLELPVTSLFGGLFRSMGPLLFDQVFGSETMRSALARSGMLERIALTPEGIPADKAIEAIDLAIDDGLPVLTFSFHSPSLAVGHTPYVRTEQQLELFYSWWEQVFTHLQKRSVKPSSIADITAAAFPK